MNVENINGTIIDFEAALPYMDNEIREDLHMVLAPCTDQFFFTAYEKAHEVKFGEEWILSNSNPTW